MSDLGVSWASPGCLGQAENSVAYKKIVIKPEMVGDLTWVKAAYQSPYGEIRSEWEKSSSSIKMNVTIPANTSALIYLPAASAKAISENGKTVSDVKDIQVLGHENGKTILKVGSGNYRFSVE